MATSSRRSLRIGVVLGDRLVEERICDGATPVTFGQSLRCTLSVPVEGLPKEHVLFAVDQGRLIVRVPAAMTGRIQVDGAMTDVRAGDSIPLPRGARGKLTIGDATILFQEVATPPILPRIQLPASIRGTFSDRIDRRLAVIIGSSLCVHVAIAAYAWSTDIEHEVFGAPHVATTYHQDMIDVTMPDVIAPPTSEPGIAAPIAPIQTPRPIVRPTNIMRPPSTDDAARLASILTGTDSERGVGGMNPRQPGADLNKQIDEARNRTITIGDGGHTSRVDDRARPGTAPDRRITDDPTLTHTPTRSEEPPRGRIIPGQIKRESDTTLNAAVVLDKINTVYMPGLQRCYRLGLADDAKLGGRVAISFTVDERGKVIDESASGLSPLVDGCIAKLMTTWRFPIPKDKDGTPADASFAVSLALQPS